MERVTAFATHDLLRVDPARFARCSDLPDWAHGALVRAPWVVVRRAVGGDGIPVGVRGRSRGERHATAIASRDVLDVRRPGVLRAPFPSRGPIDEACRRLGEVAATLGVAWGPTGAYGFELASGVATTHASSDLDLVAYATSPVRDVRAFVRRSVRIGLDLDVPIDGEVAFGEFGVAFGEWERRPPIVLAKTPHGPRLIPCPH